MTDSTDIVTRLRGYLTFTPRIHYPCDAYNPTYFLGRSPICQEAADEIERLRAERDEARREVCNMKDFHGLPRDYALERGWDCFKEKP